MYGQQPAYGSAPPGFNAPGGYPQQQQQGWGQTPPPSYGAPPAGYGAPPQGGFGGAPGGFGGAPGGYGAPPQHGYGAPPQHGYGAPPQGGYGGYAPQGAPPGGFGGPQGPPGQPGYDPASNWGAAPTGGPPQPITPPTSRTDPMDLRVNAPPSTPQHELAVMVAKEYNQSDAARQANDSITSGNVEIVGVQGSGDGSNVRFCVNDGVYPPDPAERGMLKWSVACAPKIYRTR
eukprot:TRINITY_DN233_c0_g1_i1.p1 TRINITY_DN233_c0_g1~~TRINITY_DN233_c0_g1_i1.p1  ORF type:complete len:232 (+),score=9.84 TRINITY_DN233_c0_g1_i1:68-763(+)